MADDTQQPPLMMGGRRPIMVLLDLLGQKWALRILWELRSGGLSSRALRAAAGDISPTVLQARVNELRTAGLISLGSEGYSLTELGMELQGAFLPLYQFADRWAEASRQAAS